MDEIPDLLSPSQPDKVRIGAAELLLSVTGEPSATLESILESKRTQDAVWGCLKELNNKKLSVLAAQIIVNLTSHRDTLHTNTALLIKALREGHIHLYNSVAMALSNTSRGAAASVSRLLTEADVSLLLRLLSSGQEQGYLAATLGNIALSGEGRKLLCSHLAEIIPLLTFPGNLIIRRNTARLLRNLSMDAANHLTLLEHLPMIVYPLVGPEELDEEDEEKLPLDLQYLGEDKTRESDLQTRTLLSDTLFQMGGSYKVREVYRAEGYYQLLKLYDQWEEDDDARERVQNVIYLIIQDDGEVDLRREGELPQGHETQTEVELVGS